ASDRRCRTNHRRRTRGRPAGRVGRPRARPKRIVTRRTRVDVSGLRYGWEALRHERRRPPKGDAIVNNMRVRDPVRVFGADALVAAFMTLAGCASYPRNITEGMTHDELLARFGAPSLEVPGADGDRLVYATG